MRPPASPSKIVYETAIHSFCIISGSADSFPATAGKQEQAPEASSQEQAVPRTPGEEMLAVMLVVKDQATANANAGKIRELAARLPKDMPHEESVSIMDVSRASQEYGSLDLERR